MLTCARAHPTLRLAQRSAGGAVRHVIRPLAALCAGLLCAPLAALAQSGGISADAGRIDLQYGVEHGSYQDRIDGRTELTQVPWVLRYRQGRLLMQAQFAWVEWRRSAAASTTTAADAAGGSADSARGWGDAWYKASWELQEVDIDRPGLDLTVKFKGANGDVSKSLGTGKNDLALQLEAMQGWGRSTVFGHAGWRVSGSSSRIGASASANAAEATTTGGKRQRAYAEVGFQRPGPAGWVSGAFYDYLQSAGSLGPLSELTAFTALTVGSTRWEIHAARGFNEASARFQLGLSIRNRF